MTSSDPRAQRCALKMPKLNFLNVNLLGNGFERRITESNVALENLSFCIRPLPRINYSLILWSRDTEYKAKIKLLYLRVKYSDIRIRMLDVIPFKCQKLTQSQSYCHNLCHIWTHFESKILFWTWNESGIKTQMTQPDIEVNFSEA